MEKFSQSAIEKLGFYVYLLSDPRNDKIFYVGKGCGNRVFEHEKCAINNDDTSLKLDLIRDIHSNNLEVKKEIVVHGLKDEDMAYAFEEALISVIPDLTNAVEGHHAEINGRKSVEEIEIMYNCPKTVIIPGDKFMALNINRSFDTDNDLEALYKYSQGNWTISVNHVAKANYVLLVCKGIVRGIVKIDKWTEVFGEWNERENKSKRRKWRFDGQLIMNHPYLNTDISDIILFNQMPVRYYNI